MLVRMLPEQVSANWEYFAPMIAQTFPQNLGVSRTLITNVLAAVLRGDLVVWLDYPKEGESPAAMLTTYIREDPVACIKTLLVYNLYVLKELPISYWKESLMTVREYARVHNCTNVVGYTDDPVYLRFLRQLGADTETRVAVF